MPKSPYDRIAPQYDKGIAKFERWFLAKMRSQVLNQLPSEGRVLELGAGTGLNFQFYPYDGRGVATEPSREMLLVANNKKRPDRVQLVQSCAESLPFADETFDAAFATLVFCSVVSPERAFSELRRVVKPGGAVLLLEHVRPSGPLGPLFDLMNLITLPLFGDNLNRRTSGLASAYGLEVTNVEKRFWGILNLITCRV
jgi:phosphatidylethanolamine/phosphatidyl-N-methylethanolamine N-methyltransferase